MDSIFEQLFLAWCPGYRPDMAPDYLKDDPVQAYGMYAFRKGVQLGISLTAGCLWDWLD